MQEHLFPENYKIKIHDKNLRSWFTQKAQIRIMSGESFASQQFQKKKKRDKSVYSNDTLIWATVFRLGSSSAVEETTGTTQT